VSGTSRVTDEMFLAAANCLAEQVGEDDLAVGRVYPPLSKIRDVSARIATAVATVAYESGLATREYSGDLEADIRSLMFQPVYPHYA
jgi:malate dehydrogenase (oxaloacetate-decarboxylating)(NADP+)